MAVSTVSAGLSQMTLPVLNLILPDYLVTDYYSAYYHRSKVGRLMNYPRAAGCYKRNPNTSFVLCQSKYFRFRDNSSFPNKIIVLQTITVSLLTIRECSPCGARDSH